MVTKKEVCVTERNREVGSAMRSMYCQRVLRQLTDNMLERGATSDDVAIFQSDFCNANYIIIPDSFFSQELTINDFLEENLVESPNNIKAKDVYDSYILWCKKKGLQIKTKGCFFFELRKLNLISDWGTVNGKTEKNVLKGYEIKEVKITDDFIEELRQKTNIAEVIVDKKCLCCGGELSSSVGIVKQLAEEHKQCTLCYLQSPCEYQNENIELPLSEWADSNGWIPVSERLPEKLEPVNVTWVNRKPELYYAHIKDVPFVATAFYHNGKWWWYSCVCEDYLLEYGKSECDAVDRDIDILAWQPLPEPYKAKGELG